MNRPQVENTMTRLTDVYRVSLALLTDLYELTMAFGYWKLGRLDEQACFHMSFRRNPFRGGYVIAAGLEYLLDYLRGFRFRGEDVEYLATLTGNDGRAAVRPGLSRLPRRAAN